jgi:hypothetical protein
MNSSPDRFWRRKGREVALRVNLGWWLSSFLPILIVLSAVFACLVLVARRAQWDESWVWLGLLAAASLCALICYFLVQRKFFTTEDGLTRLDVVLRLHNRLVAAAHGVGKWPGERRIVRDGWGWNWRRIGGALSLSAALLLLAGWVPIRHDAPEVRRSPEEPLAWTQIENWLDSLKAENIAEQEAIENFKEQLGSCAGSRRKNGIRTEALRRGTVFARRPRSRSSRSSAIRSRPRMP